MALPRAARLHRRRPQALVTAPTRPHAALPGSCRSLARWPGTRSFSTASSSSSATTAAPASSGSGPGCGAHAKRRSPRGGSAPGHVHRPSTCSGSTPRTSARTRVPSRGSHGGRSADRRRLPADGCSSTLRFGGRADEASRRTSRCRRSRASWPCCRTSRARRGSHARRHRPARSVQVAAQEHWPPGRAATSVGATGCSLAVVVIGWLRNAPVGQRATTRTASAGSAPSGRIQGRDRYRRRPRARGRTPRRAGSASGRS